MSFHLEVGIAAADLAYHYNAIESRDNTAYGCVSQDVFGNLYLGREEILPIGLYISHWFKKDVVVCVLLYSIPLLTDSFDSFSEDDLIFLDFSPIWKVLDSPSYIKGLKIE